MSRTHLFCTEEQSRLRFLAEIHRYFLLYFSKFCYQYYIFFLNDIITSIYPLIATFNTVDVHETRYVLFFLNHQFHRSIIFCFLCNSTDLGWGYFWTEDKRLHRRQNLLKNLHHTFSYYIQQFYMNSHSTKWKTKKQWTRKQTKGRQRLSGGPGIWTLLLFSKYVKTLDIVQWTNMTLQTSYDRKKGHISIYYSYIKKY